MDFKYILPLTPKSVSEDTECIYNIPLYQRLYEWDEPQLKGLLIDLATHAKLHTGSPYYIGMMTGDFDTKEKRIDLVDGQQRFTSLMLIALVLRYYDNESEWSKFATPNRLCFSARPDDDTYLKWLIGKHDSADKLIASKIEGVVINRKMNEALCIIKDFVEHTLSSFDIDQKRFSKSIFNDVTFFVYTLPYNNEPQKLNKYFEAMNSAGRSLEQHEKLKVELLKKAPSTSNKAALNHIWDKVARLDDTMFTEETKTNAIDLLCDLITGKKNVENCSDGRDETMSIKKIPIELVRESSEQPQKENDLEDSSTSVINFQELLLLALDITLSGEAKQLQKSKLEERFKALPDNKIVDFYRNLYLVRIILDSYVVRISKIGQRNRYEMSYMDSDDIVVKKLTQYQAMLYVSTEPHLWLTPYVEWIKTHYNDCNEQLSPAELLNELQVIDNKIGTHKCPTELLRYKESASVYLFQRLDYILWCESILHDDEKPDDQRLFPKEHHRLIDNFSFRANRSVEHFHPQNEDHNEKWAESYEEISLPKDTFGNLALISASFNSEQSNDNENVKLARIKEQIDRGDVQSLKLLMMYNLATQNGSHWTIDIAIKHGEKMMDLLIKSYSKQ